MITGVSQTNRAGFTLIEALLALALSGVLLTATFTALDHYYVHERRGSEQIQDSQVALGLMRDLQGDVQRIAGHRQRVQPPSGSRATSFLKQLDQVQLAEFGERFLRQDEKNDRLVRFYGTSSSLVMALEAGNPRFENESSEAVNLGNVANPSVSRLEIVVWCNADETPVGIPLTAISADVRKAVVRESQGHQGLIRIGIRHQQGKSSVGIVPVDDEVHELRLRYFDGKDWNTDWELEQQGRLPIAIELRFSFRDSVDDYRWVIELKRHTEVRS